MAVDGGNNPVLCVVGTRPEVIKMFPVIDALRSCGVETYLVNTGQHRGLADDAFDAFSLTPDVDLALMSVAQTPTQVASLVLDRLGPVIDEIDPSWLVVQGDTTTVMAAAIAGSYRNVPVAHVEAGLRSHDLSQPFPEEINRRLVSSIASLHFAPTAMAVEALTAEGVPLERVVLTGNTVIDALHWAIDHLPSRPSDDALRHLDPQRPTILFTTHRRENFGAQLESTFNSVRTITERRPEVQVLFPVHPNPDVRTVAGRMLGDVDAVTMTEPMGYLDMAWALQRCSVVLTDSGGLQEEGPALGKRVLVLRDVTERPEAARSGMAQLVGTDPARIIPAVFDALDNPPRNSVSPYGDGHAGVRIAAALRGVQAEPFVPAERAA